MRNVHRTSIGEDRKADGDLQCVKLGLIIGRRKRVQAFGGEN